MTAGPSSNGRLSWRTRAAMFSRLLAIQGSWNYELLVGTGIGFCTEPALRELPGGVDGAAYHEALARESRYFNAHPYLASVAVGALARAELDRQPPAQIERFRTALCGPLGSVGDRLVWAGWLPLCSLLALSAFGFGASATTTVLLFLLVYNAGHIALRAWGLQAGLHHGLRVATALANPVLRHGPVWIARAVALLAGIALPLAVAREISPAGPVRAALGHAGKLSMHDLRAGIPVGLMGAGALLLAIVMGRLHGRVEGWRAALVILALLVLLSILS